MNAVRVQCHSSSTFARAVHVAVAQFKFPFITSTAQFSPPPPRSPSSRISTREFGPGDSDYPPTSLPSTPGVGGTFMYTIFEEDHSRRSPQLQMNCANLHLPQEVDGTSVVLKPRRGSASIFLCREPLSPMDGRPTTPECCVEDDDDEEIFDPPPRMTTRRGGVVKDTLDDSGCDIVTDVSPDTTSTILAPLSATSKTPSMPVRLELSSSLATVCQQRPRCKLAMAQAPEVMLGASLSEDMLVSALHRFNGCSEKVSTPTITSYRHADIAALGTTIVTLSSPTSRPHLSLSQSTSSSSSGQQPCVSVHPSFAMPSTEYHKSDSFVSEITNTSRQGSSVVSPLSAKSQTLPPPTVTSSDRIRKRRCSDPIFFSTPEDSLVSSSCNKLFSVTKRRGSTFPTEVTTPTSMLQSRTSSGVSIRDDTLEDQHFYLPLLSSSDQLTSTPSTSGADVSSCSSSSPRPNLKLLNKSHTFMSPVNQKKCVHNLSVELAVFKLCVC